VIWPERYDPKTSATYAVNDIDVKAPPEVVWELLLDAERWSRYFPTEDQAKILTGGRIDIGVSRRGQREKVRLAEFLPLVLFVVVATITPGGATMVQRRDRLRFVIRI
jgi:hypothetical protein